MAEGTIQLLLVICHVRVIKCSRMGWAGHVARMGEEGGVGSWWGTGGKETTGET